MPPRSRNAKKTATTAVSRSKKAAKKIDERNTALRCGTAPLGAGSSTALTRLNNLLGAHPMDAPPNPVSTEASTSLRRTVGSIQRLAVIVHGAFLITMAAKAQVRASQSDKSIRANVDDRWLEGLVRYCGFTVSVPDIVECGAAFRDWLLVLDTYDMQKKHHIESTEGLAGETGLLEKSVVKLKLLRNNVPSVSEAEAYLMERQFSGEMCNDTTVSSLTSLNTASNAVVLCHQKASKKLEGGVQACGTPSALNETESDGGVTDEELLLQLSEDLRFSLSEEKLREVIAQMRKDLLGLDAKEQERISSCQRRERLVSAYNLIRILLGKKRSMCNLALLVQQMVAQNRFGDNEENIIQQLASLARYRESGITVFRLGSEQKTQQGGEIELLDVGGGDGLLLQAKEVDISGCCSMDDLGELLLRLDRCIGSEKALHGALQQC